MNTKTAIFALACVASGMSFAQSGPKGYWLSAGDQKHIIRVDSSAASIFDTSGGHDYPIAVSGDVRTGASGQFDVSDHGGQYDLNGNWMGVDYKFNQNDGTQDFLFYDGASDGKSNYLVNYGNKGGVWSTDRDWNNMQQVFSLDTAFSYLGITWDNLNNSLWVSHWNSGVVENYDMAGNLLNSWDTGLGSSLTSLAMDYTTGTLWMGLQSKMGSYFGYDRKGNLVDSIHIAELESDNTLGGEFNVVPEPFSVVALGAGLLALVRRRKS